MYVTLFRYYLQNDGTEQFCSSGSKAAGLLSEIYESCSCTVVAWTYGRARKSSLIGASQDVQSPQIA